MKSICTCTIAVLFSTFLFAWPSPASNPPKATGAFKKLQALAGDWQGKDNDANAVTTSFKVAAAGTTVLETLSMSGMDEMLTLYSVDQDAIALVHFCPTNNQPRMRAIPQDESPKELEFQFQGATNLPDLAVGHEQQLVLIFEDQDHITEQWTWRKNGKDTKMVYHFARKAGS